MMLLVGYLLLTGCTTTKLTSSWTAPEAGKNAYKKIMIVAMVPENSGVLQNKMESHLANDLNHSGYKAVTYNDVFKVGELKGMRYDSVQQRLFQNGIDGVITISLMATENETIYVKDKGNLNVDGLPLGNFWQTASTTRQEIGKPGYYVTATSYYWDTKFYDVASIALLYKAQSTAFDVSSMESLAHKFGKMIVKDLQRNYVLSTKNRAAEKPAF